MPGGVSYEPPMSTGIGDWDFVGGYVGEGALASSTTTRPGNGGGVRIIRPGFYHKNPVTNDRSSMYKDVLGYTTSED